MKRLSFVIGAAAAIALAGAVYWRTNRGANIDIAGISDTEWPAYGRTWDEQHFSPLTQINASTVGRLGLAWAFDLPAGHSQSEPVEADGKVFTATQHSVIRAFDAETGKLLWDYDPKAPEASGRKLRQGFGSRGLAYYDGKVITATHDGRLIAIDGDSGRPIWSVHTTEPNDGRFISGAPRVFDGKVIIGHGGADGGLARGYVTCYDAATGRQLWRFYTVPGNPKGPDSPELKRAAKTWSGDFWKGGGGGTVWNGISYDPELHYFYIGVGNGYPYNQQLRSPGGGDNLFLASIVAIDANTGRYVWHYQLNPGEQWDYKATADMALATIPIDGKPRKVLIQAPTNGFLYVLDRTNGKLLSAMPYAKTTWASRIDLKTGRPVENPGARYHGKGLFEMWPGFQGAHGVLPSAFSPQTGLVYIPVIDQGMIIGDKGVDLSQEKIPDRPRNLPAGMGITGASAPDLPGGRRSFLKAWDPVTQKLRWQVELAGNWPGGIMTTAGGLVFQGRMDGRFIAYDAASGRPLWSFDARAPVVAPPISYSVKGRQYVTVITGSGTAGGGYFGVGLQRFGVDYRSMPRRVLTFALDAGLALPPAPPPLKLVAPNDPDYRPNPALEVRGNVLFHTACAVCHGQEGEAAGTAPDLRVSSVPASRDAFLAIVRDGGLVPNGMPRWDDFSPDDLEAIRQYVRSLGHKLPKTAGGPVARPASPTGEKVR